MTRKDFMIQMFQDIDSNVVYRDNKNALPGEKMSASISKIILNIEGRKNVITMRSDDSNKVYRCGFQTKIDLDGVYFKFRPMIMMHIRKMLTKNHIKCEPIESLDKRGFVIPNTYDYNTTMRWWNY